MYLHIHICAYIGWFLLLSSIVSFYRVKRWEYSIRGSSSSAPSSAARPTTSIYTPWATSSFGGSQPSAPAPAPDPSSPPSARQEGEPEQAARNAEARHAELREMLGIFILPDAAARRGMALGAEEEEYESEERTERTGSRWRFGW